MSLLKYKLSNKFIYNKLITFKLTLDYLSNNNLKNHIKD